MKFALKGFTSLNTRIIACHSCTLEDGPDRGVWDGTIGAAPFRGTHGSFCYRRVGIKSETCFEADEFESAGEDAQIMRHEKEDQLGLSAWLIVIVGFAMGIPGVLVFGAVEYVCGYLIFSALLVLFVLVCGAKFAPSPLSTRAYVANIVRGH